MLAFCLLRSGPPPEVDLPPLFGDGRRTLLRSFPLCPKAWSTYHSTMPGGHWTSLGPSLHPSQAPELHTHWVTPGLALLSYCRLWHRCGSGLRLDHPRGLTPMAASVPAQERNRTWAHFGHGQIGAGSLTQTPFPRGRVSLCGLRFLLY